MVAILGRSLIGGTVLESWLRCCPSQLSVVDAHDGGLYRLQAVFLLIIFSLLGSRWDGVSVPGTVVFCLGRVVCVCIGFSCNR